MRILTIATAVATLLSSGAAFAVQTPVKFNLINVGGVEQGTNAYRGFNAAAAYWSSVLTTSAPITININVGYSALGPGILGSTGSTYTSKAIQSVETRLVSQRVTALDAAAVLPTLTTGQFGVGAINMMTPGYTGFNDDGTPYGIDNATKVFDTDGSYNNSVIGLTTANAKALGYTFDPAAIDANITFSNEFGFDFDSSNGITAGKYDFLAVAIHEIGHALGFVSGVDDYDVLGTGGPLADIDIGGFLGKDYPANDDWFGTTLDLFRYSSTDVIDWTTNTPSYFSIDGGATAFENGLFSTGTYTGDGWQASHWKAPQVINPATGELVFSCAQPKLGILNPYICGGRNGFLTGLDLSSFDAIGYNTNVDISNYSLSTAQIYSSLAVPEPASWALLIAGFGLTGAAMRRRRAVLA